MEKDKKSKTKTTKKIAKKSVSLLLPVYNPRGEIEKETSLPKEIFNVNSSPRLLAQYVRAYLINQRKGNASTKTRAQVTGSTKKIYRQKGTGRARHGDIKAPIFVGGGVVGGPKPKDYSLKLNKKQKKRALFSALTLKLKEKNIFIFSSKILKITPKTKKIIDLFKKLNLSSSKILFIFPKIQKNDFLLAVRNIPDINLVEVGTINPYLILKNEKIVFFDESIDVLKKHFIGN